MANNSETKKPRQDVGVTNKAGFEQFRAPSDVTIMADTCGDFNPEVVRALGIELIEFPYTIDGVEHLDNLFEDQSAHEFYNQMRHGTYPKTSAVTPGRYYEIFKEAAQKGRPTIYLAFTRGLSSSVEAAKTARDMIKEEFPDFELYVIDNKCPSAAAELLTMETVHQANLGMSAKDLADWVKEARYFVHGYFTLDSFDALARGGRMPAAAASIGSKLDMKPELSFDTSGALTLKKICRGKKKALKAIIEDFKEKSDGERSMPIGIMTADAEKEGDFLEALLRREPGCETIPVIRSSISPILGSHVGPNMVAMVFWGRDRREKKTLASHISSLLGNKA